MPDSNIAIRVKNLSKCYQIYDKPHKRLLQGFLGSKKKHYKEFWALKEISFEIKKGETVGIIGRNGSGKSTLLQIICGTLTPTSGSVETYGRIAALLELGSGFNPEFTGSENIYLNASILGLTQDEIDARYEDIVAFADIGDFIEQPVKTYSSGMMVRLAFAVQVCIEPDILIIDEALSVGDFFFQQKCFGRIRDLSAKGVTLLFVSHDMSSVRDLCSSAVYLSEGKSVYWGNSQTALRAYFTGMTVMSIGEDTEHVSVTFRTSDESTIILKKILEDAVWRCQDEMLFNNNHMGLLGVVMRDKNGHITTNIQIGDRLLIQVFYRASTIDQINITLGLKNKYDQLVCRSGSKQLGIPINNVCNDEVGIFEIEMSCMLEAGLYSLQVAMGTTQLKGNQGQLSSMTEWFGPLQISWDYENKSALFLGMFGLPMQGSVITKKLIEQKQIYQNIVDRI